MSSYDIAVIRGDGIGKEVVEEGLKALDAVGSSEDISWNFTEFPWGSDYYLEHGMMLPGDGVDQLASFDAIFLGAVGHPKIQDHITLNGLLLPIRRTFDQYVCERPSILYPGVDSPLAGKKPYDIDLVVIRENTEGEYANVGGFQYQGFPEEVAVQASVFTRRGTERVVDYAFQLARRRSKEKKVASITKSNAMGYGMVLWDRTFDAVKERYPDVETDSMLIDRACMEMIRAPEQFDVIVASNLFGRHPYRHRRDGHRQHGPGAERQSESEGQWAVDVRTDARHGARHRGEGPCEPDGPDTDRGHDASTSRRGRGRR